MPHVIVGRHGMLGRVAHRPTPESALGVAEEMAAEGFEDISVQANYLPPVALETFRLNLASSQD